MPDLPRQRGPRRPRSSWAEPIAERLTPAIKTLVIAEALLYFFYLAVRAARPAMEAHLALGPRLFVGEVWQPLTSLFVHFDFLGFFFNVLGIWFVGALVENSLGTRRFLSLFFVAGILSNLTIAGISHVRPYRAGDVFDGCSLAVLALFVAVGRIYGRQSLQVL